jgi:hypothetical protein
LSPKTGKLKEQISDTIYGQVKLFDPHATRVKNPFRQIEYGLFFIMFSMIFCMSDWDFTSLSPSLVRPVPWIPSFIVLFFQSFFWSSQKYITM